MWDEDSELMTTLDNVSRQGLRVFPRRDKRPHQAAISEGKKVKKRVRKETDSLKGWNSRDSSLIGTTHEDTTISIKTKEHKKFLTT